MILIHRRSATGAQQDSLGPHEHEFPGANIDHQHAGHVFAGCVFNQSNRAVVFEAVNVARPYLFGQPIDDFDTREIAFMHGAIKGLTGKSFLMHFAIIGTVEKNIRVRFPTLECAVALR